MSQKLEEARTDMFALKRSFTELQSSVDTKVGYLVDLLEGKARDVDPARRTLAFVGTNNAEASGSGVDAADAAEEEDEAHAEAGRPSTAKASRKGAAKSSSRAAKAPAKK